jgi:DNA-binding response OmpR family regulator
VENAADKGSARTRETIMNQPPRILFVDDEPSIRNLSAKALVRAGYDVDVAEDGATAWGLLQSRRFDLLVTDCNMPRLSGLELLKVLRPAQPTLPVIMISGLVPTEELTRDPLIRPTAILLKPFEMVELLEAVRIITDCRATTADGICGTPVHTGPRARAMATQPEPTR